MRFGDIVVNEHAGSKNPGKVLLYIKRSKKFIDCLDLKGRKVQFYNDKHLELTVVGSVNFEEWKSFAEAELLK